MLVKGDIRPTSRRSSAPHVEYLPGDVFGYRERDTRSLLHRAMERIAAEGRGVILYLRRERPRARAVHGGRRATNAARAEHRARRAAQRLPRLRHRRADPARHRRRQDPLADQQPAPPGEPPGLRPRDRRVRAAHARRARRDAVGRRDDAGQGAEGSAEAPRGTLGPGRRRWSLIALVVARRRRHAGRRRARAASVVPAEAVVEVTIAPGWHVNAHDAARRVPDPDDARPSTPPPGVTAGAVVYPEAVERRARRRGRQAGAPLRGHGAHDRGARGHGGAGRAAASRRGPLPGVRRRTLPAAADARAGRGDRSRRPPGSGGRRGRTRSRAGSSASAGARPSSSSSRLGVALNLTPCVYPLISVTVAFFGGRAGGAIAPRRRPRRSSTCSASASPSRCSA